MKWEETKDTQGVCQNFGQFVLPPSQVFVWFENSEICGFRLRECLPHLLGHSPFFPFEVRNGKVFHLVSYMKR
ncbi:hypothetical protein RDJ00_07005 [Bacillus subtilis]|nr:hypothetical protein [Bacillus subtilis]